MTSLAKYICLGKGAFTLENNDPPEAISNVTRNSSLFSAAEALIPATHPHLLPSSSLLADSDIFSGEEIVLGVLSLIALSLFTSLVYDIVLRGNCRRVSAITSVSFAVGLESLERWRFAPRRKLATHLPELDMPKPNIVLLVVVAVVTFSIEVALIVATQVSESSLSGHNVGFTIISPVVTKWDMNDFAKRITSSRPCISPVLQTESAYWNVVLQTCFLFNFTYPMRTKKRPYNGAVRFKSTYHSRGCDHEISALDTPPLTYQIDVRMKMYNATVRKGPLEMRRTNAGEDAVTAKVIHLLGPAFYYSDELALEKRECDGDEKQLEYSYSTKSQLVAVGQAFQTAVKEQATVHETEFKTVNVDDIHSFLIHSLAGAAWSVGVTVTDKPEYLNGRDNVKSNDGGAVFVRRTRRCTALTMVIILGALLLVKVLLRLALQPFSLHDFTRIAMEEQAAHLGKSDVGACGGPGLRVVSFPVDVDSSGKNNGGRRQAEASPSSNWEYDDGHRPEVVHDMYRVWVRRDEEQDITLSGPSSNDTGPTNSVESPR